MATDKPPAIFSLPPEILVHALAQATPQACASFSRSSSTARDSVNCTALWRALHRTAFDDPHTSTRASTTAASSPSPPPYNWAAQVKRRTQAEILIRHLVDDDKPVPLDLLVPLLDTLVDIAQTRPPTPAALAPAAAHDNGADDEAERDSLNERWLKQWVRTSGIALVALHPTLSDPSKRGFSPSGTSRAVPSLGTSPPSTPAELVRAARAHQLAAHLHVLATPSPMVSAIRAYRTAAKEIVYEHSNFRRDSLYGPFMNDGSGRVDWRKLEAIAAVCGANLADAVEIGWGQADSDDDDDDEGPVVPPQGWSTTRPHSAGPVRTDPAGRDWAGITHPGGWRGTYSFLHWPTFAHYNFHRHGPAPSLAHEHEAVGDPMVLRLELLPEGEWPPEIDQPDLSGEAFAEEDGDDDDDGDWSASASGSGSEEESSDEDEQAYFATTGGGNVGEAGGAPTTALGDAEVTPPTSLPDEVGERDKEVVDASTALLDSDDPPLSPEQLAALAAPPCLGPLPAAPHTAASATYPPPDLTFRPSSSTSSSSTEFSPLAFHGSSLPRLGFRGTFTNAPQHSVRRPSDRSIRGTVSLTPEGAVRWQYVINYGGSDQWAMNGVQVGGPGSSKGVLGVWTSADRADEGPCGPFWYWPHRPSDAALD